MGAERGAGGRALSAGLNGSTGETVLLDGKGHPEEVCVASRCLAEGVFLSSAQVSERRSRHDDCRLPRVRLPGPHDPSVNNDYRPKDAAAAGEPSVLRRDDGAPVFVRDGVLVERREDMHRR